MTKITDEKPPLDISHMDESELREYLWGHLPSFIPHEMPFWAADQITSLPHFGSELQSLAFEAMMDAKDQE